MPAALVVAGIVPSPLHRGVAIRRMALFAYLHVNRQAKTELLRVAITRERHLMIA